MMTFNAQSADFHTKLADARNALGLTQAGLAAGLGISPTMVQRYETAPEKKNSARPGGRTLQKIESFFASRASGQQAAEQGDEQYLQSCSLDELVEEIRRRGYRVNLTTVD